MKKNKFINNFIPSFIGLYCFISLLPKLDFLKMKTSFFPISSFDLYSLVPNGVLEYDLLFDKGLEKEFYLYFNNLSTNEIESKFYRSWIREVGINYENSCEINIREVNKFLDTSIFKHYNSVYLVKFTGRYSKLIGKGDYERHILMKIK